MKTRLRQLATKLRLEEKLSYSEIKNKLGIPKSTLSYWLRDLPLDESKIRDLQKAGWQKSEISRERFRNTMRAKRVKIDQKIYQKYRAQFNKLSKETIFIAGLVLYLGEGDKKNVSRIAVANTDPEIIIFFIKWLTSFLNVDKDSIKVQLHLYEDMNIEKEIKFWQNILGLASPQFYKPSIRKLRKASFSYKDSIRHGTCAIYVLSVEKKRNLSMAMKAFLDRVINYYSARVVHR